MREIGRGWGAGFSLFLFLLGGVGWLRGAAAQAPATQGEAAAPRTEHARAYYHFMLARRYKELAGVYNRPELIDRALREYKLAIEADPHSLFLRTELAELYVRMSRVGDAVREAQAVLALDPEHVDAHRLLGRIHFNSL